MKLNKKEDVVISGIGGAFPKCRNIEEFKESLLKNECLLTSRWKDGEFGVSNAIGVMQDIEYFDASYFGIHNAQCSFLDPQHRMALERTFEAIIDAGVSPTEIRGKRVGVFAGATVGENDNLFYESVVSGFGITGHARSMMPNRISYWLNLSGPSCAFEGNWLGGVDALQAAYECVSEGFCESAIVATSNLLINSELSYLYNDMGLLSSDGITKSFDEEGDGYARSDGVVVLYIQRAGDAKRSYATILGVESFYDGNRDGALIQIDQNAMQKFLEDFYDKCNVDAKEIDFIECYGAGRKDLDETELNSIDAVFCKSRDKPLLVGSVKPNTGHAEASAVLFSLAKVLVAMENEIIPATLNYNKPNSKVSALSEGRIQVVSENTKWNPRFVAINATGVSSSYGHILLKANQKVKKEEGTTLPRLLTISTRTDEGIQKCLETLKNYGNVDPEYCALIQDTFKKSIHGHLQRGYAVLNVPEPVTGCDYYPGKKRQVWFIYSGMGSQWCKMANELMDLPIFAASIKHCHEILKPKGLDLINIITKDDETIFDNILNSFVGIAAVQIALTDTLKSLGIVPDGIMGHSVGELGCAYADDCLTAEQMILCAYSRGTASLEAKLIKGMMAAVGMGYDTLKAQCPPTVEIACHNSIDSCTISGPVEDIEAFVEKLKENDVFARLVNVSNIPYHSSYIKPAGPLLLEYLKKIITEPLPRSSKWISTSIPEEEWESDLAKTSSAEYHTNNLLSAVRFAASSKHIPKDAIVVEIAPHGLLQAILKRSLPKTCTNISLTNKSSKNGLTFLLGAIGRLYTTGLDPNVAILYPSVAYPVSRGTKSLTPLVHWEHGEEWRSGAQFKTNYLSCVKHFDISMQTERYKDLIENQIDKIVIIPVSLYLEYLLEIYSYVYPNPTNVVFENLKFKEVLILPQLGAAPLYIMIQKGSGEFEISSGSQLIASGIIKILEGTVTLLPVPPIEISGNAFCLSKGNVYNEFAHRGHDMRGSLRNITELNVLENGSVAKIQWNSSYTKFINGMLQQYLFCKGQQEQSSMIITSIQRIVVDMSQLPTEPGDIQTTYDYNTGIISSDQIQIFGISAKPYTPDCNIVSLNSIEFIDFNNAVYENIEAGINIGFHLVTENFDKSFDRVTIVEIETAGSSLDKNIKNVTKAHKSITANISKVRGAEAIHVSPTEPLLVITNGVINNNCVKLLTTSHAFLLAKSNKDIFSYPQIVEVAQFSVQGVSYSILRQASNLPSIVLSVTSTELAFADLNGNLPWANNLRSAVLEPESKRIYLVFFTIPQEGIISFVNSTRQYFGKPNMRFVFLLDDQAPTFAPNEKAYEDIFKKDLVLTVIRSGSIGNYIPVPTRFEDPKIREVETTSVLTEDIQFKYLGINASDETITNKKLPDILGNIDYSGVSNTGQKILGLAHFDSQYSKLVPDPILCWNVPRFWSLADAATVPQAYSAAYYILIHKARLSAGETVLIHGGCSALGLAMLSVASTYNCNIFATVTSYQQKAYLKKQYTFLSDRNILDGGNISFEPRLLMATGGKGANIIINCLSGSMLDASLRCVSDFGKIAQIGQLDIVENTEIGMKLFLKNVSMTGLTATEILSASNDVKKDIYEYVQKGIKYLAVRPLRRTVVENSDVKHILRTLKHPEHIGNVILKLCENTKLNQLNIANTQQFVCDSQKSYLLIGDDPYMYVDIIEWVALRGGKRIIVASDIRPKEKDLVRRIALLEKNFQIDIEYIPIFSKKRIPKAESLQTVHGIFLFSNCCQQIDYKILEVFLGTSFDNKSQKAIVVNFSSEFAGICDGKLASVIPVYNVQSESSLRFSDVVRSLDQALCSDRRNIVVKDERVGDRSQETAQMLYDKLDLLLPTSISEIVNEAALALLKTDFLLLPSLFAPPAREIPPVFIIPGMFMKNSAKELSSHLLYPAYCATFPLAYSSLEKLAQRLTEDIQKVYPEGPYNIIGLSYSGPLAIQIVRNLEHKNRIVQLYLIDGAPDTIKGSIKYLGEGHYRESSLLCRVLNITNLDVKKNISSMQDWQSKLQFALEYIEIDVEAKALLGKAITTLLRYLDELASTQPSDELISGAINLLVPTGSSKYDDCGLSKYIKQTPKIHVVNGDLSSIMQNVQTANIINNNVIF